MENDKYQEPIFGLTGYPCCGKGTLLSVFADNVQVISVSGLLGKFKDSDDPRAAEVKEAMRTGKLVQDEIVAEIVADELESILETKMDDKPVIIDGFPRTVAQAVLLENALTELGIQRDRFMAIDLHVADDVKLVQRMRGRVQRALESGKAPRADDNEPTFLGRLKEAKTHIKALAAYYSSGAQRWFHVDALQGFLKAAEQVSAILRTPYNNEKMNKLLKEFGEQPAPAVAAAAHHDTVA